MAERRMFAKTIIDSDAFLDMPLSSQALYFHLSMRADDEGFINNPKKIQRMIGASEDDLKVLLAKKFIIAFESGVVVVKHWLIHNYIRNDRYKPTVYCEEKSRLTVKDNKAYSLESDNTQEVYQTDTNGIPTVSKRDTQDSIGKDRIELGKDSIERERAGAHAHAREETPVDEKNRYGIYNNVILKDEERDALMNEFPDSYQDKIDNLSMYMKSKGTLYRDHYATIMKWAREDANKQKGQPKNIYARQGSAEDLANFNKMLDEMNERMNEARNDV